MPYPKPETWKLKLDEIGAPDLEITLSDPRSAAASVQRKVQKAHIVIQRLARGILPAPEDDWAVTAMEDVVLASLVEWNLPYPDGHPKAGLIIPIRATAEEPDPLGVLPGDVYGYVLGQVGMRLLQPPKRT